MKYAPIVLFVYNRLEHTRHTIEALKKNTLASESELFIYSDGYKDLDDKVLVQQVRDYIGYIDGFESIKVFEQKNNQGLANSIIHGVSEIISKYGKVIVLEDDLVTSPYFLSYMNEALNFYCNDDRVMSISGFNLPQSLMQFPTHYNEDIYANFRNSSWGWGTWADQWQQVDWDVRDFDEFKRNASKREEFNRGGNNLYIMLNKQMTGKIDSWSIRFSYAHYKLNKFAIYPVISYVNNIGLDGSGVHCSTDDRFFNNILNTKKNVQFVYLDKPQEEIMNSFKKVYDVSLIYYIRRVIHKCRMLFLEKS